MRLLTVLFLLTCLFLPGCAGVPDLYVEADRATYNAVGPRHLKYLENDQSLDDDTRDLRKNTIASWEARLKAAEKKKE